jgi:hypothetical protein
MLARCGRRRGCGGRTPRHSSQIIHRAASKAALAACRVTIRGAERFPAWHDDTERETNPRAKHAHPRPEVELSGRRGDASGTTAKPDAHRTGGHDGGTEMDRVARTSASLLLARPACSTR